MIYKSMYVPYKRCFLIFLVAVLFSGCLSSKKLDRYVAGQYGNQLPRLVKTRNDNISVTASLPFNSPGLAHTVVKNSHVLPLLFYWQYERQHICTMNPAIFVNKFTNTISMDARRWIGPKLGSEKLDIRVEQLPHTFSIDERGHLIWIIIYAFNWDKISVQPQGNSLVVSYKLVNDNKIVKTGKISVPDAQKGNRIRMFESWKSATSEYITGYNYEITKMSRSCMQELAQSL